MKAPFSFYGFSYRLFMRWMHKHNLHYAPMLGPFEDGSTQRWCKWCGFRARFRMPVVGIHLDAPAIELPKSAGPTPLSQREDVSKFDREYFKRVVPDAPAPPGPTCVWCKRGTPLQGGKHQAIEGDWSIPCDAQPEEEKP